MSKEQATEHQAHEDAHAPQSEALGDFAGLPSDLYRQASQLRPGDVSALEYLLTQYEMFAPQILALVSSQVGLSTVNAAKQRVAKHRPALQVTGQFQQSYMMDFEAAAGGPSKRTPVSPADHAETKSFGGSETVATPAWITSARKFNAAHAHLVAEFQSLTNNACNDVTSDDDGVVDPELVAEWQRKHGLEADGKVGPRTVAEARKHTDDGDVEKPAAAPAPAAPPV